MNNLLLFLRGGSLPLFCLALSNTDYSVDCVQIALFAILQGVAPFQSIQFQLCGIHKRHDLLTAFNCLNLFALFGLMAFRTFGCPFAVVNKIPIQRVGFSFLEVVDGFMACNLLAFERVRNIHYVRTRFLFARYLFNAARSAARSARLRAFLLFVSARSAAAAVRSAQAAARSCFSAAFIAW